MNHENIKYAKEIIHALEECTWYLIEVSLCEGNPPHEALLYTGFASGAYRILHSGGYENPVDIDEYPNALIYIKQKMPTTKDTFSNWEGFDYGRVRKFNKHGNLKGRGR